MRNNFTILLILLASLIVFSEKGNATTYYFSTTDGDDSRTSTQAQNSSTPWKTISKLNSFFSSLQPGDQVLFKRGDTFYGSVILSKSGNASSPITFDAYGSGANPIIMGLTTVSSWTSVGNGLYQATVPGGLSSLNIVTFDGAFQPIGKMPKGNKGYYTVNGVGTNSITSSALAGLPSYVGGEIVWRPNHWVLWRGSVTSQSSTSVNYTPFVSNSGGGTENPAVNYGFFFQNAPAACTQLGEWAYNSSSHVITMFFGSQSPSSHTVQVSNVDNLVTSSAQSNYISFNNISFQGGNTYLFYFVNSSNIKINSCNLSFAGLYGIFGNGTSTSNWTITNNTISYCNSIAIISSSSAASWTVSGNTILNTGAIAGMGGTGENQYFGVKIRNGSVVTLNTIKNTGYIPLMFNGTNNLIQNNVIDSFGFVKDDAGGIYCGVDNLSGSKVTGNIVTNGIGCPTGTPDGDMRAQGIYVDDGASNVEISSNTVAFCGVSGIYIHNGHEINIHDNTLFDNDLASVYYYNDGNTIANVTYTNNINFAKTSSQLVYGSSGSSNSPTTYFATLDNNYYCRPISETSDFRTSSNSYSLSTWKPFIGKDANSKITPKTITDTSQLKFYYNNTSSVKIFSFGATYVDAKNTSYAGSITLQPFTSAVLVYVSGTVSNQAPLANAGPDQNITLPVNSVTLNGSGSDADGSIASYQWTKILGPTQFTIASPNASQTAVNNLAQGVYQFQLTVTDNQGATGKDTMTVTVNAALNQPPIANAGGNQVIVLPTNTATLNGSGSKDADGTITAYSWLEMSGPSSATISNPGAATSSVGSLLQGVYQFVLTVTDNQGATGKDTVTITVNAAADQPPVANAGLDLNITLPLNSVTLSGTGSDADGSIISYQWTKISGPSQYSIVSPSQSQTIVNNLVQGVYKFAFQVTDNNGVATSDTVQVVVNPAPPNLAPVANAGLDINVTLPTNTVVLNGSGTDADGTIASYQWTKVSGPAQYLVVSPIQAQTTVNNLLQGTYQFVLTVTDNQGATGTDTVNVFVNPAPNQPPTANAGADIDITLPTNSATLNGSGSDPDGSIASYQWTKISGPAQFTISTPTRATATLSNLVQGAYQFELQVTDDQGATGKDTITVTVHPGVAPNQAPTANAGADISITLPTNSVILNGSGTDTDGTIASYQWTEISGPVDDIVSPTQARTSVTNLVQGVYLFQLTVTDNSGATGGDTIQVVVNPSNQSPSANAGADINITLPVNTVTLNGSGNDPDGTIVSYQWTTVSGPSQYSIVTATQAQTTVNNLAQGVYQFQLMVTDNQGATGRDTVTVVVNTVPNQSPTANAGPDITITLPTNSVTLSGSGSDADGSIASYQWTKISGPTQFTIVSSTSAQTTVNNLAQGVYKFELKVTDNKSATGTDTVTVTVNAAPNQPPKANAGPDVTIQLPTNSATLSGSGSDPDGSISSYQWRKISGPTQYTMRSGTQAKATVSGLVQGVYQFELKVTDNNGATAADTMILTVKAANQPPTANAGANITITLPTNSVTLSGSGTDADGTIASYQWTRSSGPGQYSIASPTLAQTKVNNLVQGTYQFQLKVTDNQGATGTATVTVTVNAAPNQPPTANAGSNITITLPANSVTLNGSGTDPDGTVAGYQWTKVSGPAQFTIVSSGQRQTAVNNLVKGVYQFQLKVTDNKGATATATVTVTVNAAPNQAPTANAGADITITLPTNSVTLTGSGVDADGTIASYQWTKVSGPAQYAIATPAQSQTVVNNLAQGVYQFQLKVTDNQGATGTATVTVIVNAPPNQYPTANAGSDITITLPTNTVTLNGSGNDPDGTIASYQWTKVSGPSQFTIANPGQAQTAVNNLVQGVYQFELRVTDNQGAIATSTITVTVNAAANQPPTANTGNDITITLPTNSVSLNGSGSDPDGTIASYQWTKVSGPAQYSIATPNQAQTSVSNLVQGVYQFQLKVTDNLGATGTATMTVTVNAAPNQPPTANAGADVTITLPTNNVTLTGSGQDPDGTIVFYEWRKVSGPTQFTIVNADQAQTAVNNLTEGVYQFELTVTDNSGAMATDTVVVTVNSLTPPTNQPPSANAGGDITISLPTDSVTLNGSGSDPDGTIVSYQWTNIAGPFQFNIVNSAQAQTKVTGLLQGVYEFELMVTDNSGASARDTVFVTVNAASVQTINQAPEANAGPDINITLPDNSAILAGSGSDPEGVIASYQWKEISGPFGYMTSSLNNPQLSLSNLSAGTYQFELQVTDGAGRTGRDTANVIVNAKLNAKAKLYPNPATNMINVQISSTTPTNYTSMRIYDSKGNIVYRENFERTQQTVTRQINVSTFINGVYYLELNIDNNTMTTLIFVKQ